MPADTEEKGVTVMERKPKLEPGVQYTSATVLQTVTNPDGSVSIYQAEPNTQVLIELEFLFKYQIQFYVNGEYDNECMFQVITLADGTQAQVSGFEPGQPGVHTLAEVATAAANEQREAQVLQQHQEEQQTATAIEINGEIAGTGDGNIIIAGEDGQGKDSEFSSS